MYLEGYLYIDAPGEYTFNLDADDGALVRFGGDQAFKCCNTDGIIQSKSYSLWAHWDSQTNVVGETTQTYNLTAGYYPILITYVNMQIPIVFTFSITLPNGDVVTDFSNVYQIPNQEFECPAVVTPSVGWSQSYTSAITYSASSYDNNSVGIFSPTTTPRNISTTTTPCIGFTPSLTNLTPTSSVTTTTVEVLKPINTASTPCSITTISTSWTGFTTSSTTLNSTRTDGTTSEILSHSVAISSCQKFYNSTEVISHITVPIPSTLTNFITLTSLKSTLITVTSKDNHCTPVPVVTGYVVITDESKIYTMYSPLISEAPTSGTTGPHSHPESTTTATTDLGFVFTTTTTPVINGSISVPSTSSITEIKTITIPTIPATHLGSGNSLPLSSIATSNKHSISEQPISAPPISTIYEGFGNKLCSSLFLLIINVCAILV